MKYINAVKKYGPKLAAGTAVVVAAPMAMAQETGTDYSSLTAAVDWSGVGTALLAVGAAVVAITVVFKGIKFVTRAVKGA